MASQKFKVQSSKLQFKIQNFIYEVVQEVYPNSGVKLTDIVVEHPREESHGDFATNAAMVLAKKLRLPKKSHPMSALHTSDSGKALSPVEIATELTNVIDKRITGGEAREIDQNTGSSDQKESSQKSKVKSQKLKNNSFSVADSIQEVIVAKPGFINIKLTQKFLIRQMQRVLEEKNLDGLNQRTLSITGLPLNKKKIAVEYTDPNPFKEFHIGHLYSNLIGESVSKLLEACGATVWRGDFYGDAGLHIAKSVYGILQHFKSEILISKSEANSKFKIQKIKKQLQELEKRPIKARQEFLGQCYASGVRAFEADKKVQEEVKNLNRLIFVAAQEVLVKTKNWKPIVDYRQYIKGIDEQLPVVQLVYEAGLKWSLEYFEEIYKRLGTKFDGYYPESWVGEYGVKLVEKGLKQGVLEEDKGAVVYKGEQDGLHTRVFLNKFGLPTYEAKDLGLAQAKYQDFPYDLSLNVFGKEIDEYYKVVMAALKKIEPELGEKARYLAHGMVKLPEGKMSSRTGNVVTCEQLLDKTKKVFYKIFEEKGTDVGDERERVAEMLALGAVKYALLKADVGKNVTFDFEQSVSFEGDSGPYLQYTYARAKSVLRKAREDNKPDGIPQQVRLSHLTKSVWDDKFALKSLANLSNSSYKLNSEELAVLRTLYKFPGVVIDAAQSYSPHLLCGFLFDLAQKFNTFYNKHNILQNRSANENFYVSSVSLPKKRKGSDKEPRRSQSEETKNFVDSAQTKQTTSFRLTLTAAVAQTIKNGLTLLGVSAPEKM